MTTPTTSSVPDEPMPGEDDQPRTQFDYLLNAAESAGRFADPSRHGYRDKRLALFAYVRALESHRVPSSAGAPTTLKKLATEVLDELYALSMGESSADPATPSRALAEAVLAGADQRKPTWSQPPHGFQPSAHNMRCAICGCERGDSTHARTPSPSPDPS